MDKIDPERTMVDTQKDLLPQGYFIFRICTLLQKCEQPHTLKDHKYGRIVQQFCQFLHSIHVPIPNHRDQKKRPYQKQNCSSQFGDVHFSAADGPSQKQIERIDCGSMDIKRQIHIHHAGQRQEGKKQCINPQQVPDLLRTAVCRDLPVKRQKKVDADEKIQIPEMCPGLANHDIPQSLQDSCYGPCFMVHEDIKTAENHSKHSQCQHDPEDILPVQFFVGDLLLRIEQQCPCHHDKTRHRPHHTVDHPHGDRLRNIGDGISIHHDRCICGMEKYDGHTSDSPEIGIIICSFHTCLSVHKAFVSDAAVIAAGAAGGIRSSPAHRFGIAGGAAAGGTGRTAPTGITGRAGAGT